MAVACGQGQDAVDQDPEAGVLPAPPAPFLWQLRQSHAGSHGQPQGERRHEGDAAEGCGMTSCCPHSC